MRNFLSNKFQNNNKKMLLLCEIKSEKEKNAKFFCTIITTG